jgi:hypothetical protein
MTSSECVREGGAGAEKQHANMVAKDVKKAKEKMKEHPGSRLKSGSKKKEGFGC